MNAKSSGSKAACSVTANSQGRQMLQNDRENLELERLQNESRMLIVERRKLMAEENKLKRERFWYPVAVGTGLLTAITAVFGMLTRI
jgi:uncharacterized protein YbaP (TraB family)